MSINSSEQAIAAIDAAIKEGTPFDKITALELNHLFKDIFIFLSSISTSALVGAAIPSTNPGPVAGNRMWVASIPGVYTFFAGITIGSEEVAFLVDTGSTYAKVTIPIDLATFLKNAFVGTPGKNLYNSAAVTTGYLINYANGALTVQATSVVSDYIPVLPSTVYSISGRITSSGGRGVAYYDANKTFINVPTGVATWGDGVLNGQYTTTSDTHYMRITVKYAGTGDPNVVMVEKGATASAYEAYYTVIENLGGLPIVASKIDTELGIMTPTAWTTAKGFSQVTTGALPQTVNLFNPAAALIGYHINNATGLLTAQAGSSTSDFIAVMPSTAYYISGRLTSSGTHGVAYYDTNQNFINTPTGTSTWGDGPLNGIYTTTSSTYYIRITTQFAGTGTLGTIQVEKGLQPSTYVAYQSYNAITKVNGEEVFANDRKVIEKVNVMIANRWTGKKICWMGTSIPANYPNTDKATSYPNIAASRTGAIIVNESLASSLVRIATSTGAALSSTFSPVSFGKTGIELTAGGYNSANSYETKMLGHLDADLFIFDFGYNDYSVDSTSFATMPANVQDRNYFIGAMNYCVYKLLEQKPKARIAIFGHYENQSRPNIAAAQQVIADYWSCPIFKTWQNTNWGTKVVPGGSTLLAAWLPDGIHPGSDTSGAATSLLANLAETFIRNL